MFNHTDIRLYFKGEKLGSIFFLAAGIVALLVSLLFYFGSEDPFFRGMSFPTGIIGMIQVIVGVTVYRRSDPDIQRVSSMLDYQPALIKELEYPRMLRVMKSFALIRWVVITLFVAGIVLFILNRQPEPVTTESTGTPPQFWKGVGAGLAIQSLVSLTLDFFAEKRGVIYTSLLRKFVSSNP